jgi:hypothetical protein
LGHAGGDLSFDLLHVRRDVVGPWRAFGSRISGL